MSAVPEGSDVIVAYRRDEERRWHAATGHRDARVTPAIPIGVGKNAHSLHRQQHGKHDRRNLAPPAATAIAHVHVFPRDRDREAFAPLSGQEEAERLERLDADARGGQQTLDSFGQHALSKRRTPAEADANRRNLRNLLAAASEARRARLGLLPSSAGADAEAELRVDGWALEDEAYRVLGGVETDSLDETRQAYADRKDEHIPTAQVTVGRANVRQVGEHRPMGAQHHLHIGDGGVPFIADDGEQASVVQLK